MSQQPPPATAIPTGPSANGHVASNSPPRRRAGPLPYLGAHKSPRRYGSINAAFATMDLRGLRQATVQLFAFVIQHVTQTAAASVKVHVIDPAAVLDKASSRLLASTSLAAPLESAADLARRQQAFQALAKKKTSPHDAEIKSVVCEEIALVVGDLRAELEDAAAAHLPVMSAEVAAVRQRLEELESIELTGAGLSQLSHIVQAFRAVASDKQMLPDHKLPRLTQLLLAEGHDACQEALRDIAAQRFRDAWNRAIRQLRADLERLDDQSRTCREHFDAVEAALVDKAMGYEQEIGAAEISSTTVMDGPSAEVVVAAVASRFNASRQDAVVLLAAAYVDHITARWRLDPDGNEQRNLWVFVKDVDPAAAAEAFGELVQGCLQSWSQYRAAEQFGIDRLVEALFGDAEPLLLLCRTSVRHNIELGRVTIVEVPAVKDKVDAAILKKITDACRLRDPEAPVQQSLSASDPICVCRVTSGFPVSVSAENYALLAAHVRCERQGHHPNLCGVRARVEGGKVSKDDLELWSCLQTENKS